MDREELEVHKKKNRTWPISCHLDLTLSNNANILRVVFFKSVESVADISLQRLGSI